MRYTIRVHMTPLRESPKAPYLWDISREDKRCMIDFGQAKTPEEAWKAAQSRYREIEGGTQHDNGRST